MKKSIVIVRDANPQDVYLVFELRNRPETYQYFESKNTVDLEDHKKWFKTHYREFKIIEVKSGVGVESVGFLRFQHYTNIAIAIKKETFRKGYGSEAIKALPKGNYFCKIHNKNKPSFGLFQKSKFSMSKDFKYFEKII